jgi:hypothetical protein
MVDIEIPQDEADALIQMPKYRINNDTWHFPGRGRSINIPLQSEDKRNNFLLDLWRSRLELHKITYQNRSHQVIILVRLDLTGKPHKNPDDEILTGPHIHIYQEGYADKWAYPVSSDSFSDLTDQWQTLKDFMTYCNIVKEPNIIAGIE